MNIKAISENGAELVATSLGTFSNAISAGEVSTTYHLERTPSGWETTPSGVPSTVFSRYGISAINTDLGISLWTGVPASGQPTRNFYLTNSPDGPFVPVGPSAPPTPALAAVSILAFVGASRDFSRIAYAVPTSPSSGLSELWPGDLSEGEGQKSLYEYSGTGNTEPRLVGVKNEGRLEGGPHVNEGAELISQCGTYLGGPSPRNTYNAISEDGSKVFFTAVGRDYEFCSSLDPSAVQPSVNELYVRENGTSTVAISEPSEADCRECDLSNPADAHFVGASVDGSKVFFTTTQHLLAGATGEGADLYEYDFGGSEGERLNLVSAGDPAGARVESVKSVSSDGSHIYFLAQGVLTATPNASGQHAEEGAQNLYVYERRGAQAPGKLAFIATGDAGTSQSTPDGRFLVFESAADLTADQENMPEAGQVFEYDAETGVLVRVSRGQDGYNNDGNTDTYRAKIPAQSPISALPSDAFNNLAMSSNGAYVFFTSEDGLTPQAQSGATNVYEYHGERVSLVSDGHDSSMVRGEPAVTLVGTDESGQDVYFTTTDPLLPQDVDTQVDLYDARVDGGFPSPPSEPECAGDTCQGALTGGVSQPSPLTSTSNGEGALVIGTGKQTAGKSTAKAKPKKKAAGGKARKRHVRRSKKKTTANRRLR